MSSPDEPVLTQAALTAGDDYVPHRDVLDNEVYLISRGVRPLALVGHCPADPVIALRVRTLLCRPFLASHVLPFVLLESADSAAFGYASQRWCIDLLQWALTADVPPSRKHEILGLLLGYSPAAIARHQERAGLWEPDACSRERPG